MINCYSSFYVRAIWTKNQQSILEVSSTLSSLLLDVNSQLEGELNRIYLLMNENQTDNLYELKNLNSFDLAMTLADGILQKTEESIRAYHVNSTPNLEFSDPIGFTLYFYTDHKEKDQFTISLKVGAANDWNNYIDFTFPENFNRPYVWYLNLLERLLSHFPIIKGGVYPEFTTRLKGNPSEYPGWITYYRNDYKTPPLPSSIILKEYGDRGVFYILTEEDFEIKNQAHIQKWKEFYLKFSENN